MKSLIAVLAVIALLALSCNHGTEGTSSVGRFTYDAYDSLGNKVARGWFSIADGDASGLRGLWQIEAVGATSELGPQIGRGVLSALLVDGQLFVEFNPQYRDNNVGLAGTYDGQRYEGSWTYSGLPGVINVGTFSAVRQSE